MPERNRIISLELHRGSLAARHRSSSRTKDRVRLVPCYCHCCHCCRIYLKPIPQRAVVNSVTARAYRQEEAHTAQTHLGVRRFLAAPAAQCRCRGWRRGPVGAAPASVMCEPTSTAHYAASRHHRAARRNHSNPTSATRNIVSGRDVSLGLTTPRRRVGARNSLGAGVWRALGGHRIRHRGGLGDFSTCRRYGLFHYITGHSSRAGGGANNTAACFLGRRARTSSDNVRQSLGAILCGGVAVGSEGRGRIGQGSIFRAGRVGEWREMSCGQIQFGLDFVLLTLQ